MNPYRPTNDSLHKHCDATQGSPAIRCVRTACTGACWFWSGICFLLLPFATVGAILFIGETARQASVPITDLSRIVIVPICLAAGGLLAARASMRWQRGNSLAAILDSISAVTIAVFPWCLEYATRMT